MMDSIGPQNLRISLAAAMELGLKQGFFYRDARLHCINLLLTYDDGCKANCAFCGLSRERSGLYPEKKFIRVEWPTHGTDTIIERLQAVQGKGVVQRVCLSMITHPEAVADALALSRRLTTEVDLPLSALITPTLMDEKDLQDFKDAGVDRIGVAIDCATPEIFDDLRGKRARGPHKWERYWDVYEKALAIFGPDRAGVHLICGLGETEAELAQAMQRARDMGGFTHLFSFFPEGGSRLARHTPPPIGQYRRIQVARWLIDHDLAAESGFHYDGQGRITGFGVARQVFEEVIKDGKCFMTSGCPGATLETACNRPFANERPGPDIRNYPFHPTDEDIAKCRGELWTAAPKHVVSRL